MFSHSLQQMCSPQGLSIKDTRCIKLAKKLTFYPPYPLLSAAGRNTTVYSAKALVQRACLQQLRQ